MSVGGSALGAAKWRGRGGVAAGCLCWSSAGWGWHHVEVGAVTSRMHRARSMAVERAGRGMRVVYGVRRGYAGC